MSKIDELTVDKAAQEEVLAHLKQEFDKLYKGIVGEGDVCVEEECTSEEKVNDWENWVVGDTVKCVDDGVLVGCVYKVRSFDMVDSTQPVKLIRNSCDWWPNLNFRKFVKVNATD